MLRLTVPSIEEDDLDAVADVLRSGFLVQGPHVERFEAAIRARTGSAYAVAVSNCTSALHLTLAACGIGPGDVVAVPAYSWPATINVVALVGAEPAIVDVDPCTFNLDPRALVRLMERRNISAVIPVHAFGGMADMRAIKRISAEHNAVVIEDAACALGASLDDVPAGRFGRAGCFSFHPRKAVTTGEGGVVVTDDGALATRIRALRNHGLDQDGQFILPGHNARMTDFQAAFGMVQLGKLDRVLEARRRAAARYDELFSVTPITTPAALANSVHAYQSYVVLLPPDVSRADLIAALRQSHIESTIGTHALPFIRWVRERYGYRPEDFPVVHDIASRALTLPLHEYLTDDDQQRVVEAVVTCVEQCSIA